MNALGNLGLRTLLRMYSAISGPLFYVATYSKILKGTESVPLLCNDSCVGVDAFTKQIRFFRSHFTPTTFGNLASVIETNPTHPPLIVTFEHGYSSVGSVAADILLREKIPATVFLTTSNIEEQTYYWWDEFACYFDHLSADTFFSKAFAEHLVPHSTVRSWLNEGLVEAAGRDMISYIARNGGNDGEAFAAFLRDRFGPEPLAHHHIESWGRVLDWESVAKLVRTGFEVGIHGSRYQGFDGGDRQTIRDNIEEALEMVAALTGVRPKVLSYPFGQRGEDFRFTETLLRDNGVAYACGALRGVNRGTMKDPFHLKRVFVPNSPDSSGLLLNACASELMPMRAAIQNAAEAASLLSQKVVVAGHIARSQISEKACPCPAGPRHLFVCICDHYEPYWDRVGHRLASERVAFWADNLPKVLDRHRDADGEIPKYDFFYPEEEFRPNLMASIAELCRHGYGEVNIHLHHHNDTSENTRATLIRFRDLLCDDYGLLSLNRETEGRCYGFIHGNWALDNSRPDGKFCGVNDEITILQETGCFADFTMPSAPCRTQTKKINSIYYAVDDPEKSKSHNDGTNAQVGGNRKEGLLMVQGPLGLRLSGRKACIENGELSHTNPPTAERISYWVRHGVSVVGQEQWTFVKLHTHGAQERVSRMMFPEGKLNFLYQNLIDHYNDGLQWNLHFVSSREMVNIIHAAEDGISKWKNELRNYIYTTYNDTSASAT